MRNLIVITLFILAPSGVLAQSSVPVEKLLFEPVPLSEASSEPGPFAPPAPGDDERENSAETDGESVLGRIYEIEEYLDSSEEFEAEDGPYSNELRENLVSLGNLYQQMGNHEEAVRYLERALNITHVNNGLNTLDQVPILKELARSYLALGRLTNADETRDRVLELYRTNHGRNSLEVIPAMSELGDWNIRAFLDRSNIVTNIQRIDAQEFITDPNNFTQERVEIRDTPLFKLSQAQQNFLDAIDIIVQEQEFDHPALLELEHKLRTTYMLSFHRENILYQPDFYLTRKQRKTGSRLDHNQIEKMNSKEYEMGQKSIDRSLSYIVHREKVPARELARTLLEDADWDLLFSRKVKAADRYREIYGFFKENPDLAASVHEQLYPEVPVVLPTYLPPPNSRAKLGIPEEEEVEYSGYFDVSFALDEYGKARKIRVLDKGGRVTRNMEIRIKQYLQKLQFRPRFNQEGEPDTSVRSYRYNVGY